MSITGMRVEIETQDRLGGSVYIVYPNCIGYGYILGDVVVWSHPNAKEIGRYAPDEYLTVLHYENHGVDPDD